MPKDSKELLREHTGNRKSETSEERRRNVFTDRNSVDIFYEFEQRCTFSEMRRNRKPMVRADERLSAAAVENVAAESVAKEEEVHAAVSTRSFLCRRASLLRQARDVQSNETRPPPFRSTVG